MGITTEFLIVQEKKQKSVGSRNALFDKPRYKCVNIGSSELEVERWTFENKRRNFEHRTLNVERRMWKKELELCE